MPPFVMFLLVYGIGFGTGYAYRTYKDIPKPLRSFIGRNTPKELWIGRK